MTNTYFIGNNSNNITLAATISAAGVISSEADNELPGGASKEIADSGDDETGTIQKTVIDKSSNLSGCKIEIKTIVTLDLVDPSLWLSIFKNLTATYSFTGGNHSDVSFGCDDDDKSKSTDGSVITISKSILLTMN
jgi:hypothetical protein